MNKQSYELGTIEASEQLIHDLYIDLRKKANHWASITHQTAQARMGYVGQHLVSVVTGYRGGRSGTVAPSTFSLLLPFSLYSRTFRSSNKASNKCPRKRPSAKAITHSAQVRLATNIHYATHFAG